MGTPRVGKGIKRKGRAVGAVRGNVRETRGNGHLSNEWKKKKRQERALKGVKMSSSCGRKKGNNYYNISKNHNFPTNIYNRLHM